MLIEVKCDKFSTANVPDGKIVFHKGLNTILGTESGSNSIGKSTFLMILDFVFGGTDYIDKCKDVHSNVGEHTICFAFEFNGEKYYFSRSNIEYQKVWECDSSYNQIPGRELSLNDYFDKLKELYSLDYHGLSFRGAVGRFIRVYHRDNMKEDRPLDASLRVHGADTIMDFVKLCNLYSAIEAEERMAKEADEKEKAFKGAHKYSYISYVSSKREYEENEKRIAELVEQRDALLENSHQGININTALQQQLVKLEAHLADLNRQCIRIDSQIKRLKSDRTKGRGKFTNDFSPLLQFFPDANVPALEAVENFHHQISAILDQELKEAEKKLNDELTTVKSEMKHLEESIEEISATKNLTKAVAIQYSKLETERSKREEANKNYLLGKKLSDETKEYKKTLDEQIQIQVNHMEQKVNSEMNRLNDFIYHGKKNPPVLKIKDASHYEFYTYNDTGTGTQYKGMIIFDLTMLNITKLPILIHDSVLLKNIEDYALEKLLELYMQTQKQVFIAIDKAGSYTEHAEEIMESTKVLQLGAGVHALFGKNWNEIKEGE